MYSADQSLDRLGAGRGSPQAVLLHRLAQLLVVDQLARGLHRREQCRLGVPSRRARLLGLALGGDDLYLLPFLELWELGALRVLLLGFPVRVRLDAVDAAPSGLERHLAARAEALILDEGDDLGSRVAGRRVEDGEEPARDQVEDPALVR